MSGLIQRLLPARSGHDEAEIRPGPLYPRVLVITADVAFYAAVLSAVNSRVWQVDWARSVDSALAGARPNVPILLYDQHFPRIDWREAFERFGRMPNHPRLLLAARSVDEQIWRAVLVRDGYDVVLRSADSARLKQALRFAWLAALRCETGCETDPLRTS